VAGYGVQHTFSHGGKAEVHDHPEMESDGLIRMISA
jgi:hypothetical protein